MEVKSETIVLKNSKGVCGYAGVLAGVDNFTDAEGNCFYATSGKQGEFRVFELQKQDAAIAKETYPGDGEVSAEAKSSSGSSSKKEKEKSK